MRNQQHGRAARPGGRDSAAQSRLAFRVKIGVGFIQHHDKGIAIKSAGQTDALALSGGES